MHNAKNLDMKRLILILFLCMICVLTCTQCRKKGHCLNTYTFTEQDKQIIPYSTGSTFILIDSLGVDSLVYSFTKIEDMEEKLYDDNIFEYSDYIQYMNYNTVEKYSIYGSYPLLLSLYFINPYLEPINLPPIEKTITFAIAIPTHPQIREFRGFCYFNNGVLYQNLHSQSEYNNELLVTHLDTLNIFNKQFYSVYSLSPKLATSDTTNRVNRIYYSTEIGFVGIKTSNGKSWRILQ
jgi:hypothetical protein